MNTDDITKMLPDGWFDWYARLIPGCIGVATYFWLFNISFDRKIEDILLLAFLSYVVGHITQPFSSSIVNKLFKNELQPRTNRLISKSYAETISMFSSSIITIIIVIYSIFDRRKNEPREYIIPTLLIVVFFVGTWLRGQATKNKIKEFQGADTTTRENEN